MKKLPHIICALAAALLILSGGVFRIFSASGVEAVPAPRTEPAPAVNINTADRELLMALPGIGPGRADAISLYRAENGGFASPEELLEIPGIGEGTLDGIRDYICTGGN